MAEPESARSTADFRVARVSFSRAGLTNESERLCGRQHSLMIATVVPAGADAMKSCKEGQPEEDRRFSKNDKIVTR